MWILRRHNDIRSGRSVIGAHRPPVSRELYSDQGRLYKAFVFYVVTKVSVPYLHSRVIRVIIKNIIEV